METVLECMQIEYEKLVKFQEEHPIESVRV